MRGNTGWQYRPYSPLQDAERRELPFICRMAPFSGGFEIQWLDNGQPDGSHILRYRPYQSRVDWTELPLTADFIRVDDLADEADYECQVARADGSGESNLRLAHTGFIPGTVVNYLHPDDKTYAQTGHSLCSPSLVRLPSGDLLSAMDVFDGTYGNSNLTLLFKSRDEGKSWRYMTDICPSFTGTLFVHRGALYLLARSHESGDLLIGRSDDEGETWTIPTHILTGDGPKVRGPHRGPMPVVEHEGRLYTSLEFGSWTFREYRDSLLSIDADANLLDASNWTFTPFVGFDSNWPNAPLGFCQGCIEGNAIVGPDGIIRDYLRIDHLECEPKYGRALILKGNPNDPEAPLTLDRIVNCPLGSNSKFTLREDPITGKYIMIGTEQGEDMPGRTVLSLAVSEDFYSWRVVKQLIDYRHADPEHVAFQYPDWIFDGDDILMLTRTAFGPSYNFHDANYQLFFRIENFRQYL